MLSIFRECAALGGLFQQVVNDMKVSGWMVVCIYKRLSRWGFVKFTKSLLLNVPTWKISEKRWIQRVRVRCLVGTVCWELLWWGDIQFAACNTCARMGLVMAWSYLPASGLRYRQWCSIDARKQSGFVRTGVRFYQMNRTHSQMLGKIEYTLPAKFWRLVGCTEMLSW